MPTKRADVFGAFDKTTGALAALQQPGGDDLPLPSAAQVGAMQASSLGAAVLTFDGAGRLLTRTRGDTVESIDWTDAAAPVVSNNKGAAPLRLVLSAGRLVAIQLA